MIELHQPERLVSLTHRVADGTTPKTEGHVLEHSHVGEERIALEDGVHGALERLGIGHIIATDQDTTGRWLLEPGDKPQGRGLATS